MDQFYSYLESIAIIKSQEVLTEFTIADYPHMKKEDRARVHKEIYKKAYPSAFTEKKRVTLEDVARMLNGR